MRILKKILLVIGILIATVLISALFIKKDFAVEKEVVVNKPKAPVFDYLKHVKNQANYNTWWLMDPGMKLDYKGEDGTEGFVAAWDSDKSGGPGKGEQTIKKIAEGERIDIELHFIKPLESYSPSYLVTDSIAPGQTRVKWGVSGKMAYPFNFMRVFMSMDDMMGNALQEGLVKMKDIVEKQ